MNFRVLLNRRPTSTQLILISTKFFDMIRSKISHLIGQFPQIYVEKFKVVCFAWKLDTHGILEVQIPNPHLDFWNSNPKIHFWANFGRKSQSCPFCLKISKHSSLRMLILILRLVFWVSNIYPFSGQIWVEKIELSTLPGSWYTKYLQYVIVRIQRKVWKQR